LDAAQITDGMSREERLRHERRYQSLIIDSDLIIDVLKRRVEVVDGIPDDALMVNVSYEPMHGGFAVIIAHESYDSVKPWIMIPAILNVALRRNE
jgi:hypothetical protein